MIAIHRKDSYNLQPLNWPVPLPERCPSVAPATDEQGDGDPRLESRAGAAGAQRMAFLVISLGDKHGVFICYIVTLSSCHIVIFIWYVIINIPPDLSPSHDYDKICLSSQCRVNFWRQNSLLFKKKMFVVNPYRVLCLKTSRILTRLFLRSQRRQGLSSFGQDVFFMTFPTPLLPSHIHPQHFVGLTTNCAVNGI